MSVSRSLSPNHAESTVGCVHQQHDADARRPIRRDRIRLPPIESERHRHRDRGGRSGRGLRAHSPSERRSTQTASGLPSSQETSRDHRHDVRERARWSCRLVHHDRYALARAHIRLRAPSMLREHLENRNDDRRHDSEIPTECRRQKQAARAHLDLRSARRRSCPRATSGRPLSARRSGRRRSVRPPIRPSALAKTLATATIVACSANKKAPLPGLFEERMMGLEPTTFCMASRRSSQLSYIRVGRQYSAAAK